MKAQIQLSGLGDEAGSDIHTQIRAHRELGWTCIDLRAIDGVNVTMMDDAAFERAAAAIDESGLHVTNLASGICCWGRSVRDDFALDLQEMSRAIGRMRRLRCPTLRVMSCPAPAGADIPQDEFGREAFRRLGELSRIAAGEGIVLVHEQVSSAWSGEDPGRMLQLVETINCPAFRLLLDLANFSGQSPGAESWAAYQKVKRYVAYVHLKDRAASGAAAWFSEGVIPVRRLLTALRDDGYAGVLSMEPHVAAIHHTGQRASPQVLYDSYLRNARKVQAIVREVFGE
jgi:sugar phosphate isomerase/epimerase